MLSGQLLAELLDGADARRATTTRSAPSSSPPPTRRSSAPARDLGGFAADVPLVDKHFASRPLPRVLPADAASSASPRSCAANGHVLAGGLGLALACDLIIAKEGADFGTPEINVGAFPFMIMAIIYRNVPRKKINEMLLLGERLSAEEAVELGLVNKVVPAEEFDAAVADWAAKLASKCPLLMRLGKDAM